MPGMTSRLGLRCSGAATAKSSLYGISDIRAEPGILDGADDILGIPQGVDRQQHIAGLGRGAQLVPPSAMDDQAIVETPPWPCASEKAEALEFLILKAPGPPNRLSTSRAAIAT